MSGTNASSVAADSSLVPSGPGLTLGNQRRRPRLMTSETRAPRASRARGRLLCEITRPSLTRFEKERVTLPVAHLARVSALRAAASVLPRTSGTRQMTGAAATRLKIATTFLAAFMLTAHARTPAQSPDQPAKREPEAATALRTTAVPAS